MFSQPKVSVTMKDEATPTRTKLKDAMRTKGAVAIKERLSMWIKVCGP